MFCSYHLGVFEWDEDKRKLNLVKHGIDFDDVHEVFDGPTITVEDRRQDYGEQRYVALGILQGFVVSVSYTERGENLRLISVRKAKAHEERYYLAQF